MVVWVFSVQIRIPNVQEYSLYLFICMFIFSGQPCTPYVAKDDREFLILLPPPSGCWVHSCGPGLRW